ncbi:filamin-A-like isoform X2 [Mytilus galloprovincialis]|uniref:filamin-A-like isoform X2 n=1 Tax=Mytilus galloprovincialis TaxID=29158 RepID=UPI003F7C98B3
MNRKTISFTKDSLYDLVPTSNMQWEDIQKNTFTNWVNEQLNTKGIVVRDIRSELSEHLGTLVEVLQRQQILGITNRSDNQYARLQNITVALEAITSDGVRIVSIDSSDIADGNLKLILALIWQLILRYQIGNGNIQNKSWLLAWIQAVIPQCKVTNLTTDWNDGLALNALLEFCMPGLSPHWMSLDRTDKVNNCHYAMKLARQQFGIPLILRAEHLASTDLDELSSITYLSYFIKVGSPGYNATLQRIQPMVHNVPVFNFTTDWNDGRVLTELVTNLGARIQDTSHTNISEIQRLQEGIDGATQLGVEPLLTASDIAEEDQEHIGIMAYAAKFLYLKPENSTIQSTPATNGVTTLYEEERRVTSRSIPNISHRKTTLSSYPVNGEVDSYKFSSGTRSSADYSKPISIDTNQHSPMLYRSQNGRQNGPLTTYHIDSNANFDDTEDSFVFQRIPSLRKEKGKKHKTDTLDNVSGVKVDTYSVGVIISTTSHEIISKDEVIVEAESPSGRVVKLTGDGNYNAQFTPDEIGEWKVSLFCHGKLVDSCPIDVCDPSQVKVTGLKGGIVNKRQYFTVDCHNAGKGDLEVFIDFRGTKVPCSVKETQTGVYTASYLPYICGVYSVRVSFNKSEIRDSDYLLGSDSDGMHRRAIFSTSIEPDRDKYNVKSTCDWQIDYITGGPFEVLITDKADIKVYSMQDGTVCNFPHLIADCSGLDPGRIEAHVSYKGYRFPANTVEDDPGIHRITFQPRGKGTYKIWIVFDGRMVKGSPFTQEIEEIAATAVGEGLRRGREGHETKFKIDARGFPGELSVTVEGPHYPINCNVVANDDGTHTATYVPEEAGPHRIHVKLDGKNIDDSPFRPLIVDPSKIRVSGGWEPLLDENDRIPLIVNKEKQIPFDASEAGLGELTAEVHGPSYKVPVAIDSRIGGKHTLIFTPKEEGRHYIDVKWCDFPISPKPFLGYAVWLPESDNQHQPVLSPLVVMQPKEHHSSDPGHLHNSPNRYNYHLIHPTVKQEEVQPKPMHYKTLSNQRDRSFEEQPILYTSVPNNITIQHQHPTVKQQEVQPKPMHYKTLSNQRDRSFEEQPQLYTSVPNNRTLQHQHPTIKHDEVQPNPIHYKTLSNNGDRSFEEQPILYTSVLNNRTLQQQHPTIKHEEVQPKPMHYKTWSNQGDRPLEQQPIIYASVPNNRTLQQQPTKYTTLPNSRRLNPESVIYTSASDNWDGHLDRVNGDALDGPWVNTANTKPATIYVTKHKRHKKKRFSSGSSSYSSSSSSDESRKKVPQSKVTLLRKVVDEPKIAMVRRVPDDPRITVVRRVQDDPKITLVRRVQDDPRITVVRKVSDVSSRATSRVLVPRRAGSLHSTATTNTDPERVVYRTPHIYTTYMANSPSRSSGSSRSPSRSPSYKIVDGPALSHRSYEHSPIDSSKVILSGKGLKQAFVNKEATFNIDGRNAGPGEPSTKMFSPKYEIPIEVKPIGPKQYRCTYIPAYPGAYLLDIKWNERKLKCCPFKINVNPPFYPEKVNVSGANIKGGMVGKDFHLQIDPRKAGKGKLTAKCSGPSNQKVAVSLVENIDGTTKVSFKPVEAGRHIMSIKYNKEHVLGSPYAIDIKIPHHSGIVYVHGPGIENNGVLGEYESHFWVDARDAGSGELNVSVMGPKGAFNVEMKRDSQKDRIFHCRYNPHEPGTYTINCKWSGHHVGNSPYRIHLGVSKDDLDRFLLDLQHGETLLY